MYMEEAEKQIEELTEKVSVQEKDIIKLETEISTSTSLGMKRIQTKTESEGSFGKNEEEDIEIREVSVKEIKSEENSQKKGKRNK